MNRVLGALKATYNFFAGDAILLVGVALAFVLAALLGEVAKAPNPVVAVVFVGCIISGLATTLGRELKGRKKP
ncbi:MAG TPA: hypothetical protein VH540_24515 [Ktedonobacterales bacterium]|jgi:hypothetical protein